MDNNIKPVKKESHWWDWILWWKIDDSELQRQVNEYDTLKIQESARGLSFLLTIFSLFVTIIMIVFLNYATAAWVDGLIMLILGFFIYRGHRWAMITAMIMWTVEKIYTLSSASQQSSSWNAYSNLFWWALYMHAFYLAFRVEQLRKMLNKAKNNNSKFSHLEELEKLSELKNKGIITQEEFDLKKKQALGL